MKTRYLTTICTAALLCAASCSKGKAAVEAVEASEEYVPEEAGDLPGNVKEFGYIPECPYSQEINTDNLTYETGYFGYDAIQCLDSDVSKKDRFAAYSKRVESAEPSFEPFFDGNKFPSERIVNIVAPIEIKAQHPWATHLTALLADELVEEAFPEEYRIKRSDGSGLFSLPKTVDAWLNETEDAVETDYLSQGIAIFPWTCNDQYVQYCILTHSSEGGNSDMPEIKFVFAGRQNHSGGASATPRIGDITDGNKQYEVSQLAQKYLSQTLESQYGEPFTGRLDFRYSWETPQITYEEDGIIAWFPKGSGFMGTGIIPVKIPLTELRPLLRDGHISYWNNKCTNWRKYPMLSSYGPSNDEF